MDVSKYFLFICFLHFYIRILFALFKVLTNIMHLFKSVQQPVNLVELYLIARYPGEKVFHRLGNASPEIPLL